MNLERDLRDALRPLAGDPVDDARAVLAQLEDTAPPDSVVPEPAPALPRAPLGLPLAAILLGVLALGIVVGLAASSTLEPTADDVASKSEDPDGQSPDGASDPKGEDQKSIEVEDKESEQNKKPAPPMETGISVTNFGPLEVDEPGAGVQTLQPNLWRVALGTQFRTGAASTAGLYVYGSDIAVRLARDTVAVVDERELLLQAGKLWTAPMGAPERFEIAAGFATVLAGNTEAIVERDADGCTIMVLDGWATVRGKTGDKREVTKRTRVRIDQDGAIGPPERIEFLPTVRGWMTQMIILQQDQREMHDSIAGLVEAYVEGSFREEAVRELRRYGARIVPSLYKTMTTTRDEELRHRTAAMIARHAEFSQAGWLFAMLEGGDEEVRAAGYRGLARVVGGDRHAIESEDFWRTANAAERAIALERWRERLR